MSGQIIKIISNQYTVKIGSEIVICQARGKFRNDKITPVVGDYCLVDFDSKVIIEILPRKNILSRPPVANIDVCIVVTSIKEPNLSLNLLDKLISLINYNNIEPVICFTKLDLMSGKEKYEIKKITKYYQKIGYKVFSNKQIKKLKKYLKNKTVALTGQTGAGKSSLLNRIDSSLNLIEGEISKALGRGKHTTRHVELFFTNQFLIVDTPGFSALDLNLNWEELKATFIEFNNYHCPFKNCRHINETECQVKKAVKNGKIMQSRYDNYLKFGGER